MHNSRDALSQVDNRADIFRPPILFSSRQKKLWLNNESNYLAAAAAFASALASFAWAFFAVFSAAFSCLLLVWLLGDWLEAFADEAAFGEAGGDEGLFEEVFSVLVWGLSGSMLFPFVNANINTSNNISPNMK